MKRKVNFIIPYFGTFPNYMQLFLNSCSTNENFQWTIITDNYTKYNYPDNVKVVYTTFEELAKTIQNKFDFEIKLEHPYKFCDMKPMYGYLFEKYNENFKFWGYCDIDVIFGDLDKFITDEKLEYDKLFIYGHMTIMRNTEKINKLFMDNIDGMPYYKTVLQSNMSYNFDEEFLDKININTIFKNNDIPVYRNAVIADIFTKSSFFRICDGLNVEQLKRSFFLWNKGTLTREIKVKNKWYTEEYMYIHLQKRKMKIQNNLNYEIYKIIPNTFSNLEIEILELGEKNDQVKWFSFNLHYLKLRIRNLKMKLERKLKE